MTPASPRAVLALRRRHDEPTSPRRWTFHRSMLRWRPRAWRSATPRSRAKTRAACGSWRWVERRLAGRALCRAIDAPAAGIRRRGHRHRRARHGRDDLRVRTARRAGRQEPAGRAPAAAGLAQQPGFLVSHLRRSPGGDACPSSTACSAGTSIAPTSTGAARPATSRRRTSSKRPATSSPRSRVRAAVGRTFDAGDTAVAVISHAAWQRRFGSDPSAVGRTIRVGARP